MNENNYRPNNFSFGENNDLDVQTDEEAVEEAVQITDENSSESALGDPGIPSPIDGRES